MKETNYWQRFMHTGRVEDYLCYCRKTEEDKEQLLCRLRDQEGLGVNGYAGFCERNRDDFKSGAGGRI